MSGEELKQQVFNLLADGRQAEALALLEGCFNQYQGKALGTWYYLYALTIRRCRPADRTAFTEACIAAARLFPADHENLCTVYLTQVASFITWGDWQAARTYIRRIRGLINRHRTEYSLLRIEGMVRVNEGLVDRAAGDFARAAHLLETGIADIERYAYPVDARTRAGIITMARLDIADCYLRLGQHGKAVEFLSRLDPDRLSAREFTRYCYVQSRYWLALGALRPAQEWLDKVGAGESWDPDWPVLLLEVQARLCWARGERSRGRELLQAAFAQCDEARNPILSSLLHHTLSQLEGDLAP